MADFTRRRWTRPRIVPPRRPVDEEINPSSGWTNDFPGFHCLLVNLPGFEEDDIKLNVNESGIVVVSGRRKVDDEKQEHFEKTFNVPEDGDVNNIIKIFDGATLRVRIPKVAKNETSKPSSADVASTNNINTNENNDTNKPAIAPTASPASSNNDTKGMTDEPVESAKQDDSPASSNGTKRPEFEVANKSLAPGSDTNEQDTTATTGSIINNSVSSGDTKKNEEQFKRPKDENTEKPKENKQEPKSPKTDENTRKLEEKGPLRDNQKASVLGKIAENKGILLASIISFTLGVLLSNKMHSSPT